MNPSSLDLILDFYPELQTEIEYDEVVRDFKPASKTAIIGVVDNFTDKPTLIYSETLLKEHQSINNLPGVILSEEGRTRDYFDSLADSISESTQNSPYLKMLFADGFDDAIVGVVNGIRKESEMVVAYSQEKCIEILMKQFSENESSDDDEDLYMTSYEYYQYNVVGGYVGPYTPVFIEECQL